MSKSKNFLKDRYTDEEEETKKPKFSQDKRKEKRIKRALKTKNIEALLEDDEDNFHEEEESTCQIN